MPLNDEDFRQLIPLLNCAEGPPGIDALRAWYEAVADALESELAVDLFALWIYGSDGEPVLIEPQALAQDGLVVPRAEPLANRLLLSQMEDRVRRAGYGSVLLRPIHLAERDVGLLLLATFPPHAYGIRAGKLLDQAHDTIAGTLARLAPMAETGVEAPEPPAAPADAVSTSSLQREVPAPDTVPPHGSELFAALADALSGAGTPRDLMLAISFALQASLPHDACELLIPDSTGEQCYRLGLHGFGPLWADPALVLSRATVDLPALFAAVDGRLLIADAEAAAAPRLPPQMTLRGMDVPPRSVVGVPLRVVERTVGYLLLGGSAPGVFRHDDLTLLDRVASLLAPRVDGMVLAWQFEVLRGQFDVLRHVPMHLARVAELLASTPFLGEGSRLLMQQAQALLPISEMEFAVGTGDAQRVVIVRPGSLTPLADLPQEPIEGTGVSQVVRGEEPYLLTAQEGPEGPLAVLVVPLRVAGRIVGAMAISARGIAPFTSIAMALAQQLADLAAPHLDLARRTAPLAPPFMPGWKRPTWRAEIARGG
jgi:hypothetical protein